MRTITSDDDVLGGSPRLSGTRIGVLHIYRLYQTGYTPESIASDYDGISVADVHTALAFAFDNPETIRAIEAEERDAIEDIRERRTIDPDEFKQRA